MDRRQNNPTVVWLKVVKLNSNTRQNRSKYKWLTIRLFSQISESYFTCELWTFLRIKAWCVIFWNQHFTAAFQQVTVQLDNFHKGGAFCPNLKPQNELRFSAHDLFQCHFRYWKTYIYNLSLLKVIPIVV